MMVRGAPISFSTTVKSLDVYLDKELQDHERLKIMHARLPELGRISSIRHFLTADTAKKLVTPLILSRSDDRNSLFAGLPQYPLQELQHTCDGRANVCVRGGS